MQSGRIVFTLHVSALYCLTKNISIIAEPIELNVVSVHFPYFPMQGGIHISVLIRSSFGFMS